MRLQTANSEALKRLLLKVNQGLDIANTKAQVVRVLSQEGYCSPNSSGIEKSLLKRLQQEDIEPLGAFGALMGHPDPEVDQVPDDGAEHFVNPRYISKAVTQGNQVASAETTDGDEIGSFDLDALRSIGVVVSYVAQPVR